MDINNLKAFIAVADRKSFSRSAEQLHLTQPAVSKRIAALESELSTRLFDRIGRKVHLTEAGEVLLPSARQISAELDRIEEVISNLGREVTGKLSIASTHYLGVYRLPPLLRNFREKYPDVHLDLHFEDSSAAMAGVERGVYELALCAIAGDSGPKLREFDVWSDELVIAVANDHPLAEETNPTVDLLVQCPALLPSEPSVTRAVIDSSLAELKCKPAVALEASQLETLKMMVTIGLGWSCLPRHMVDNSVTVLEIPDLKLERKIALIRHHERTLSRAAQAFLEILPALAV